MHSVAIFISSGTRSVLFNLTDSITVDGTQLQGTKMNWAERVEAGGEQKKEKGLGGKEPLNLKGEAEEGNTNSAAARRISVFWDGGT